MLYVYGICACLFLGCQPRPDAQWIYPEEEANGGDPTQPGGDGEAEKVREGSKGQNVYESSKVHAGCMKLYIHVHNLNI